MNTAQLKARIATLEDELRTSDERIKELRRERDEDRNLIDEMRAQLEGIEEHRRTWTQDMIEVQPGVYQHDPERDVWKWHEELAAKHLKLIRDWNAFVNRYNAIVRPLGRGRPLEATETQVADVLRRHKAGASIRGVAAETALGVKTVRSILNGSRREAESRQLRKREIDRSRASEFRRMKRIRDAMPGQLSEERSECERLIRASKGLGEV